MLRLMLDSHPELAIPGESQFIPAIYRNREHYVSGGRLDARRMARDILGRRNVLRWRVPNDAVFDRIREISEPDIADVVESVFMEYALARGKTRWGDKTPRHVMWMDRLSDLFPSALFVHVIRDGRDVSLSYADKPWGPRNAWESARLWRRAITAGLRARDQLGRERYLEVRYERLVSDPEATVGAICAFARLDFHESMLDYYKDASERLMISAEQVRFHASSTAPPRIGIRDWRTQMSEGDVRAFESAAGEELGLLGYERRYPSMPARSRALSAAVMQGLELRILGSRLKAALARGSHRAHGSASDGP